MEVVQRGESRPSLTYERSARRAGHEVIAGVDEVGRGSWAGPVVAAAVILPRRALKSGSGLEEVRDSKQLGRKERRRAYDAILASGALVSLGWASHHVVDRDGIAFANRRAMCRAIAGLPMVPQMVLIDHFSLPECELPQTSITRGDSTCLSIAAASVIAKVCRDTWMIGFDRRYPGYGFAQHKGYGTIGHRAALAALGISPLHRRSFAPVAALLA